MQQPRALFSETRKVSFTVSGLDKGDFPIRIGDRVLPDPSCHQVYVVTEISLAVSPSDPAWGFGYYIVRPVEFFDWLESLL
jgi:hypothetical protein